ncbi:MAG: hypothetical protein NT150_08620 [Bacteroidetes bacterium]|nr:hypothetical protein [Bacteroidota bacterium]
MKFLILLSSIFLLSFTSDDSVVVKNDGFYVGKVRVNGIDVFQLISFQADGNACTYQQLNIDIKKAYADLKNKNEADFAGPYIIHAGNIVYRSNNSINKKEQPEINQFFTYQGKMNDKGQLVLWVTATDGAKTECTFDYYSFPK